MIHLVWFRPISTLLLCYFTLGLILPVHCFVPAVAPSPSLQTGVQQYLAAVDEDVSTTSNTTIDWDWKRVAASVFEEDKRPIILFDGLCNLCNGGVNFAIDHDPNGNFRFASLHSTVGKSLLLRSGRDPNDINSIVCCLPDGAALMDSDAVIRISKNLVGSVSLIGYFGQFVPGPIRGIVYNFVSKNRYRLGGGEYDSCRLDFDGEYDDRFVSDPEL